MTGAYVAMLIRLRWFLMFFFVLWQGLVPGVRAENSADEIETPRYKWFLTVYGGAHAQDDINDVFTFQATFHDNAYVAVAALAREFWHYDKYIGFEIEGQVGKHFNKDDQWEFAGLIVGRWHAFPWDNYVDTSFAVGDGVSYYSEISEVEKEDDEDAQRALNYLMFELALGLPQYPRWNLVFRVHHRSSVFGLVGAAGSNFVCGGLKFSF
jgi:hypothetical protein